MIDPIPLTGIPWLDAAVKIAGAIGLIGSLLANVLPKTWGLTEILARFFADGRKLQAAKGAVAEADAQDRGKTTVPAPVPANEVRSL
jgi:hypothetical protein